MKKRPSKKLIAVGILIIIFLCLCFYLPQNYYPPILMYHNIDAELAKTNTIAVSEEIFEKQMAFIAKRNYKVVRLEELCRMIKQGQRLPPNILAITFDDGYKDNLKAVKILAKYNFPATIFIVMDWIDKPGYLTRSDLSWIKNNSSVFFGSHTVSHSYLPNLLLGDLKYEIRDSKSMAKKKYGLDLSAIAYPVGGFTHQVSQEVESAGYLCACSTNRGFFKQPDIYALRRIKMTGRDLGIRLWGKFSGFYTLFKKLKPPY